MNQNFTLKSQEKVLSPTPMNPSQFSLGGAMFAKLMKNPGENWGGWISHRCCQQGYRFKSHWCWWQYLFYGFSRWNFASSPFFNRRELLRGVVKFSLCDWWLSWCSVILTATENFTKGWLLLKLPIWVGVGGLELVHLACLILIFEKVSLKYLLI